MASQLLKSGLRYILSYLVVSVICSVFIVMGNDILGQYSLAEQASRALLQVNYEQWLPVCAIPLLLTAIMYLVLARLIPGRLPLLVSGLICGCICVSLILFTGVCTLPGGWYEAKNLVAFFLAGFSFAILVEMLD